MKQQGVCPRCLGSFQGVQLCPRCGIQLQERRQASVGGVRFDPPLPPLRRDSLFHRFLVGLICSQACYFGCRSLGSAGLAITGLTDSWWFTTAGIATLQTLQATSVMAGALLISGARRSGAVLGFFLGITNALLMISVEVFIIRAVPPTSLLASPIMLMIVGAISGSVGSRIWRPFPDPLTPALPPRHTLPHSVPIRLYWGRLLIGSAVTVAISVFAADLFGWLIERSAGILRTGTADQNIFIIWEITLFAAVLGGVVAGSEAPSWLAQGFLSGFLAVVGVILSLAILGRIPEPPHAYLIYQFGATDSVDIPFSSVLLYAGGQTLVLTCVGAWLGGTLFPHPDRIRPSVTF